MADSGQRLTMEDSSTIDVNVHDTVRFIEEEEANEKARADQSDTEKEDTSLVGKSTPRKLVDMD